MPTATPSRSSSRVRERAAKSPSRARATPGTEPTSSRGPKAGRAAVIKKAVDAKRAELDAKRAGLGLLRAPLLVSRIFARAALQFLLTTALSLITKPAALLAGALLAAYSVSTVAMPSLYEAPTCGATGTDGGPLFLLELWAYDISWWLMLGILSSIGFGTGLHSGIMFLWPFVIRTINQVEVCGSSRFPASYNHPCVHDCTPAIKGDGSASVVNTILILLPTVVLWGSGTAVGELPPYFITRAARRAGSRAADFEDELAEAKKHTDPVSRLKVMTIDFTKRHGFVGILLLASWPNAAFDMCGMACGWLEMPFWTFFGATLIGKGVIKVTLQTVACTLLFGPTLWSAIKQVLPSVGLPTSMCSAAGGAPEDACELVGFLSSARDKAMLSFSLQNRYKPADFLGGAASIDQHGLVTKYCAAMAGACGEQSYSLTSLTSGATYSNAARHGEMVARAARAVAAYDIDGDGALTEAELAMAVSASDSKLSLASLDPGTGGIFSVGALWNAFIAGLVIFFVVSIVEQVAASAQASEDEAELEALQQSMSAVKTKKE